LFQEETASARALLNVMPISAVSDHSYCRPCQSAVSPKVVDNFSGRFALGGFLEQA